MKIVVNTCFGRYGVKESIIEKYGISSDKGNRTDAKLIELIESGIDCNGDRSELTVVDIPDESTDYMIEDYYGIENVLYVVDGKIYKIDPAWSSFLRVDPEWLRKCVDGFNAQVIFGEQL